MTKMTKLARQLINCFLQTKLKYYLIVISCFGLLLAEAKATCSLYHEYESPKLSVTFRANGSFSSDVGASLLGSVEEAYPYVLGLAKALNDLPSFKGKIHINEWHHISCNIDAGVVPDHSISNMNDNSDFTFPEGLIEFAKKTLNINFEPVKNLRVYTLELSAVPGWSNPEDEKIKWYRNLKDKSYYSSDDTKSFLLPDISGCSGLLPIWYEENYKDSKSVICFGIYFNKEDVMYDSRSSIFKGYDIKIKSVELDLRNLTDYFGKEETCWY